jgi:hypothetical protein
MGTEGGNIGGMDADRLSKRLLQQWLAPNERHEGAIGNSRNQTTCQIIST